MPTVLRALGVALIDTDGIDLHPLVRGGRPGA